MRTILRWIAATLAGVALAVAFVALVGCMVLLGWDHTHPPLLPGPGRAALAPHPAPPGR